MSVHIVKVPDIGEGIAEVEVVEWYVQPGDTIKADQTVADLMTDKATVEVPSPISGRVVSIGGKAGDKLAVGAELIRLETDGAGTVGGARPRRLRLRPRRRVLRLRRQPRSLALPKLAIAYFDR